MSHEAARPAAVGKHVAGRDGENPGEDESISLRTPCGPSHRLAAGTRARGMDVVDQKPSPEVSDAWTHP